MLPISPFGLMLQHNKESRLVAGYWAKYKLAVERRRHLEQLFTTACLIHL
jgi:hypothetical protein